MNNPGSGSSRYGNGQGAYSRVNETNQNLMEMENNAHIAELGNSVAMLKDLSQDIGNEVKKQNLYLDGMSDQMGGTSALLGNTMKKLGTMLQQGGSKHMCYLIIFIVFVFLMIWYIIGHKGTDGS
eukprot:CAMPEP_0117757480 /NCGR_PEP_ID=MMETSP0947-20121206/14764_1 /TAXON_ID=44440 /ORGANISM="Chattonella subsalsa, Strain CCMP2191" /LENGTH=124 /DNA_ID=CAMNT_0005577397 /DNA_START=180 /DNA_END=554 /DNA_ORIENTATION=+